MNRSELKMFHEDDIGSMSDSSESLNSQNSVSIVEGDLLNLTLLQHTRKPFSNHDLVESMIKLIKARKNKLFKGIFKVSKNGKNINYIMSK